MASIRKRTGRNGDTTYQVMVRKTGFPCLTETFPTRRLAEQWAATQEGDIAAGRASPGSVGRKRTLAEAIIKFRAEVVPLMKSGTMYGFTLAWWETTHGTKLLGEVSRGWLSEARGQLLTGTFRRATPGSKRSAVKAEEAATFARTPATANRYMAALSAVFSQVCGDWEWLQPAANPFTGFSKLAETKGKGRGYADDARARLLAEAAKDPQLHRLCRVALGTAARAGELLGLTWSHVELGDKEGRLMLVDTKNGETRIAWLFGDALQAMREQHAYQFPAGTHPAGASVLDHLSRPVFPGQWSHKDQKYGRYDYLPRLHKALAAAGLKMARPFHALRHTAATTAARMGANTHQLKALGGWKSDAVNTYVHIAAEDSKALSQQLANKMALPNPNGGK